jgi:hypothetical protein
MLCWLAKYIFELFANHAGKRKESDRMISSVVLLMSVSTSTLVGIARIVLTVAKSRYAESDHQAIVQDSNWLR